MLLGEGGRGAEQAGLGMGDELDRDRGHQLLKAPLGDEALVDDLQMGFRTSGLAVIALDGPMADIEKLSGRLEAYLTPAGS